MRGYSGESRINLGLDVINQRKPSKAVKEYEEGNSTPADLHKGQILTGRVSSTGDAVFIKVHGLEAAVPKEILEHAVPGQTMEFEVMNISGNTVELRITDPGASDIQNKLIAVLRLDADGDILLNRKEQDTKKAERDQTVRHIKGTMEEILARMTEQDYRILEQEGFPVEELTVQGLDLAIRRIKSLGNRGLKDIEGFFLNGKAGKKKDHKGDFSEKEIRQRMKEENLPVTKESVQKVVTALGLGEAVSELGQESVRYLIRNELPPTVENIYKAKYISKAKEPSDKLSDLIWGELELQVKEAIEAAGYPVNKENQERARWLLENRLPLTKESFAYLEGLEEIKTFSDKSKLMDKIMEDMKGGTEPKDTILLSESRLYISQLIEDITLIRKEHIIHAVDRNKEITIEVLKENDTEGDASPEELWEGFNEEQRLEVVTARRQIEEIRLKMTLEAVVRLEKKGIHIETERLEKIIEELRLQEEQYYKGLLSEAGIKPDEPKVQILRSVTLGMEQLKALPSYILGITINERRTQTVPNLLEAGTRLQTELDKANKAYESLLTPPSSEYGDSLKKAFDNLKPLMDEMGIEDTVYNRRAIRILGYNRMEITRNAIDRIKAYDLEVNTLMNSLHPAVAVRMIKEGISPMELPIGELNRLINKLREEQGITDLERYSRYLYKLEKETKIPERERKAYIGIYRLLHQIEKSDGAALGALLKAGREVTLNHLLSAVRTIKKGSIDTAVDDEFGALQEIYYDADTVTDQIGSAFQDSNPASAAGIAMEAMSVEDINKEEILDPILKRLLEIITPEKLKQIQNALESSAGIRDNGIIGSAAHAEENRGIWEAIRDMPIEKLLDQMGRTWDAGNREDDIFLDKLQEIREIYKNCDQAIRFMEDFKVPCNTVNVMLAGQILAGGGAFYKKLAQYKESNKENLKNKLKKKTDLSDTLIDRNSMNEAMEQLEDEVKAVLEQEVRAETISFLKAEELKFLGYRMEFLKTLARREFYQIPIETKQGITSLNLTVIRGTKHSGRVTVSLQSDLLGRVRSELTLKDNRISGYIACDNRNGLGMLKSRRKDFEAAIAEENTTIWQLEFCFEPSMNGAYAYQNRKDNAETGMGSPETEKILYRIARGMVSVIRSAEAADAATDNTAAS